MRVRVGRVAWMDLALLACLAMEAMVGWERFAPQRSLG